MADYKEGQGVQTHRDNDFATKLVDGASGSTATHILSIVKEGETHTPGTNDFGIPFYVEKEDGTYCLPAADDNCALKVVIVDEGDDTRSHSYKNHSAIAAASDDDHDSAVITSGSTVKEVSVTLSSAGCMKYSIGEYDGTATFTIHAVLWTQPASPSICCTVCLPVITGDGSITLRIRATNKDDDANDAYSTICYKENAA